MGGDRGATAATYHRRLPIATVAQALIDFAAQSSLTQVRRALSEAEYNGLLDIEEVQAVRGRGRPARRSCARPLRTIYRNWLAREPDRREGFLLLCERARLPLPEMNAGIGRMTVDALWTAERLMVETDTYGTYGSPSRMARD